jgi:ubiquinone/menaquinone biosynthesis C-methylase UbiE
MADESMVRNLAAQAQAIWPQEALLFARYGLRRDARILDAGCGTGEAAERLAEMFPHASIVGVDIVESHLERARARCARFGARVAFEKQSVYELASPDRGFDLTVCRHVIHAIPYPERVLAELARVTRRGGWLHVVAEDYGMLHFQAAEVRAFWNDVPAQFATATGTDLFIGRNVLSILAGMAVEAVRVDYLVVDTLRVPRETFASILTAWRDGYADSIGELTTTSRETAVSRFDAMVASIRDPRAYAAWMVPVASARIA